MTDDAALADDGDEHEDDTEEAAEPGLAVISLAGATGAAAGFAAGGPFGAAVGAAATPFLAAVFQKTVDALFADRKRRAEKMLETAIGTAGLSPEQFAHRAGESEQTRFLTEKAIQAAAETIWPEGVRAIGRAYAAGLLAKDKPVLDIRLRVIGIMQDLDELHVRLLDLLVRYEPKWEEDGYVAVPHDPASHVNLDSWGDPMWMAGGRKWDTGQIGSVMPEIEQVLPSLLGELRETGLIQENDIASEAMRHLAEQLIYQVNVHAFKMKLGKRGKTVRPLTLHQISDAFLIPTWSPTELGEKILGFYAEAGAEEDSQDQG